MQIGTVRRPRFSTPALAGWSLLLLGVCVALGAYATRLNSRFYASHQPFFDSLAYYNQTHHVMTVARQRGLGAALGKSPDNIVCLPFLLASAVAIVCPPSRHVGTWIQVAELGCFALSWMYYLVRVKRVSPALAAALFGGFLSLHCLYYFNGGLSDYRMDLSLFLMFATTSVWCLAALATGRKAHFVLLGLAAAATCLFRATAPVYLLVSLFPLVLVDLLARRFCKTRLLGVSIALGTASLCSLWYYGIAFDTLYYYYAVWNTAANANLPWSEALLHFDYVAGQLGPWALAVVAGLFGVVVVDWVVRRRRSPGLPTSVIRGLLPFEWRLAWLAFAPTAMLVARGAGLNPFVQMPSLFGAVTFLLVPLGWRRLRSWKAPQTVAVGIMAVVGCLGAARQGWNEHAPAPVNAMVAHQRVVEAIANDGEALGCRRVRFASTHLYYLNPESLRNVMLFDMPSSPRPDHVAYRGIQFRPHGSLSVAAEADWARVPGGSTEEKLDHLVSTAQREIDYLIVPTAESAQFLQENIAFNVINRYGIELRTRLLAGGRWVPVSDCIANRKDEVVRVYRNLDRLPDAGSPSIARARRRALSPAAASAGSTNAAPVR
jgi:hypothetical protein